MSFLEKTRPGPKTGQRKGLIPQSPVVSAKPSRANYVYAQSNEKYGMGIMPRVQFSGSSPEKILPTVQMQRSHMNIFLTTLINRQKKRNIEGKQLQHGIV